MRRSGFSLGFEVEDELQIIVLQSMNRVESAVHIILC